ncbi:exonuclease domain-containing protein [Legionella tunisiensis]|uniref:exonuclease domain-containing protein n=1 Tax=Legionella tunisiensis TaxID=1034944 RepID=UPI0002F40643|nr:exonuclease domain-containing protein [Legionella tunisiensis]
MRELSIHEIAQNPDFQILRRVPSSLAAKQNSDEKEFIATIIDLETMGLDANKNEIIELGLLSFSFSTADGILRIIDSYNELNDPGKPIPPEVTKVTGISDGDVKGKSINWDFVLQALNKTHLVICHNSGFDRNFLELQTPQSIKAVIESMLFACTIKDIDWKERGYESYKLDYLNWKLGFFMMDIVL